MICGRCSQNTRPTRHFSRRYVAEVRMPVWPNIGHSYMTIDFTPYAISSLWLDPVPKPRTLLVAYPHPDDESFGNGGTLARYVAQGVAVHYACATRGECGTIAPALLAGHADIAALRTAEQECAARA